ncbi:hypothetical protein CULT_10113 [[Clostridium] ultunense Esp]|uniref:hypothetical protein n=1 Tax=Thermicanus aegyptius TaxID=94009 RepID=UPI0002B70EAF|nr:hypothetical protein [Thermicanus aegyptius]CCQ92334.1 hypothetical protein CULT_10113 [[Clostridium] ultunense Esp]
MISNLMVEILRVLPQEQRDLGYHVKAEDANQKGLARNRGDTPLPPLRLDFSSLKEWKEFFPSMESSRLSTLLKFMGEHSLPFTPEVALALDSFLFGPPLAARMGELLRLLSQDSSSTVKELRELWGQMVKNFSLEEMARIGIKGEGERSFPLFLFASMQELLHRLKGEKAHASSQRWIRDIDLWFTGQQFLLRQDGEANYFHTLLQFPFYHRDEPLHSFMEIIGRRKGKEMDPSYFSLSLSMELPLLGEMALRLYVAGRNASLYFFSDLENGHRLLMEEKEKMMEGLKALGYRLEEVRWAPLSSLKKAVEGGTVSPFPAPHIDHRV